MTGQPLEEVRETNARLNRRLGSMEHELHSLVSAAQREAGEAIQRAADSQRMMKDAYDAWFRALRRTEREELATAVCFLWAVAATVAFVIALIF